MTEDSFGNAFGRPAAAREAYGRWLDLFLGSNFGAEATFEKAVAAPNAICQS